MNKKFDTTFTQLDDETFDQFTDVLRGYPGAAAMPKILQLFESGLPANGWRQDGKIKRTYLDNALNYHNNEVVDYLIRNTYQDMQEEAFILARAVDNPTAVRALLDMGHSYAREMAECASDFWWHAKGLSPDIFRSMIKLGANLDAPAPYEDKVLRPPIVNAAGKLWPHLVANLLSVGVDPGARAEDGYCALHVAVMEYSTKRNVKIDTQAKARELEEVVRLITSAGVDIDTPDNDGRSALHLASSLGYAEKAKVLLEAGADPYLKDKAGKTPEALARSAKRANLSQIYAAVRAKKAITDVVAKAAAGKTPN